MIDKLPELLFLDRLRTPIGEALLVTDEDGVLRAFDWSDHEDRLSLLMRRRYDPVPMTAGPAPAATIAAVRAYFAGQRDALGGLAWRTAGTDFQQRVWLALTEIPVGETISYGELARRIGSPMAVRAVGLANGANPVGVVVPCHRVIGADGSLTGYGGGLERKRWLLNHEGAAFRETSAPRAKAA
ncbi:MAG: methylated-DNA--[protein]-cysteine S-methyltransferase [Pseudomonadota bacterium]|nr:methylated-DNA--[protein]-cysteine S-methyltransferase [Pseudomonadota bacterium]